MYIYFLVRCTHKHAQVIEFITSDVENGAPHRTIQKIWSCKQEMRFISESETRNKLFSCFETRINLFQFYKIETIYFLVLKQKISTRASGYVY